MYKKGYDCFYVEIGNETEMICNVCGTKCEVHRGALGPTCWAEAMAKVNRPHDAFRCPYGEEAWHQTARELKQEIENSSSKRIRNMIRMNLEEILNENLRLSK